MYNPYYQLYPNELEHFGVLGMKWGVRRYQNTDGTLTAAGKKHYDRREKVINKATKKLAKLDRIARMEELIAKEAYEKAKTSIEKASSKEDKAKSYNNQVVDKDAYYAYVSIENAKKQRQKAFEWSQSIKEIIGKEGLEKTEVGQKYLKMAKANSKKMDSTLKELEDRYNKYKRTLRNLNMQNNFNNFNNINTQMNEFTRMQTQQVNEFINMQNTFNQMSIDHVHMATMGFM